MKLISKFAASPFSGYALIALVIAAAGAGYWFWTELKEFGSLSEKAAQQELKIDELEKRANYLQGQADKRVEINSQLVKTVAQIESQYRDLGISFSQELNDAPEEYLNCRNMLVPDGLRHPDAKNRVSNN